MAHGETYASEFGWDESFEALVAQIVSDYAREHDPDREGAWIAEHDGERVGCVFLVAARPEGGLAPMAGDAGPVAKLRILLVQPEARGHGLGHRLVQTALDFARAAGYSKVRLWTNHPLVAARKIYLEHGFALTAEEPHRSFGADLLGQTYELDLHRGATAAPPIASAARRYHAGGQRGRRSTPAVKPQGRLAQSVRALL